MPIIHDISIDRPREHPYSHDQYNWELYILLKQEIFYDYRNQPPYRELFSDASRDWIECPRERLERSAVLMDGPAMLELSLRNLSLADLKGSPEKTLGMLKDLTGLIKREDGSIPHVIGNTPLIRLRAMASIVYTKFRSLNWSQQTESLSSLQEGFMFTQIADFTDLCAMSDFLPPIVIRVMSWFAMLSVRFGVDLRSKIPSMRQNKDLWKAWDGYIIRQAALETARLAKIAKAPNQYRCAADGCEIQAVNKNAFKKCPGDCSGREKAHYCSKGCQRKHWMVHRYVCTRNPHAPIIDDDGDSEWIDIETYEPNYDSDDDLEDDAVWATVEGPEIFIDIPLSSVSWYRKDDVLRIRTKTFSPAFLRSYKSLWQLSRADRKHAQAELLPWPDFIRGGGAL
ncbi:hypothetical protein L226DRAFT_529112 [Lentinus tigrinus ALCF2SS1-7]|uniref:uncharacterized protein n=1 Tax=Lentinus tigrinus ALCF2SS1-7 TaxID=1328758 RepID=UPI0011661A2D|nr:hypothetical protein L226DRAFT_529112 [Lentinus tigrinus ALCF2SS1-7]